MEEVLLQIENLVCGYGRKTVLSGLSLNARAGKCVVIAGSNGCGKSTLFSVLAGLKKIRSGSILIKGEKASEKRLQRLTGYVPQDSPLFSELTVWDNLLLWYGNREEIKSSLKEGILGKLGLQEILKKEVGKLSGGMQRRVCIGCAMAGRPDILIMDEPGAALDLECKASLHECLREYRDEGGCILLSSHDEMDLALADELYILRDGKLYQEDRTLRGEELLKRFHGKGKEGSL